jgi:acetyl-CoA carboxylase carboxyltransferase component
MTWLVAAEGGGQAPSPPAEVLDELALAAPAVFARVEEWFHGKDRWRQVIALSALVRRLYAPKQPEGHRSELVGDRWVDRSRMSGKLVLAAVSTPSDVAQTLATLAAVSDNALALEIVVPLEASSDVLKIAGSLADAHCKVTAERVTLTCVNVDGTLNHTTLVPRGDARDALETLELHGLHPETAARVDLPRYRNFILERMWGPEDIYCFFAISRQDPEDQRLFVLSDVRARPTVEGRDGELFAPIFERAFQEATRTLRLNLGMRDPRRELHWNRVVMHMAHPIELELDTAQRLARRVLSNVRYLGVEKTIVRLKLHSPDRPSDAPREIEVVGSDLASSRLELTWRRPRRQPLVPATPYERKVADARRRGLVYPYEIIRMLTSGEPQPNTVSDVSEMPSVRPPREQRPVLPTGTFEEYDIEPIGEANGDNAHKRFNAVSVAGRERGQNPSAVVFGIVSTPTTKVPEGMRRVLLLSDPTRGMGALGPGECDRVVAALDLAERLLLPVEWIPVSSGARIAMNSGTENLDATARVVRRIVTFTQGGGVIHLIITGVNVGAQSYWDSLATMLMHTRGVLIMTPQASMVLTGSAALAASGSVSAEDEVAIGGHERVMGPNGQAQYFAPDLLSAYEMLFKHYTHTYVVPGEGRPRRGRTSDPVDRDVRSFPYEASVNTPPTSSRLGPSTSESHGLAHVGDIFDDEKNPGRKRPFSMRAVMRSVIDRDAAHLERWNSHVGAETAIVWDAQIGGYPVCLMGIESQNTPRMGYRPFDGPEEWNGGTLFPQSSKKVARALNAVSGNRPAVILANLSGFDGSPESMRKLQLEYGAEIARAVVNFQGPLIFVIVSRYHGGAYVVFSRELNENLQAIALEGSYASVIGGGPAATVIFPREVRARVAADPRIEALRQRLRANPNAEQRAEFDRLRRDITIEKRAEVAAEFDSIHSVERAKSVGSLDEIIPAVRLRPFIVELLDAAGGQRLSSVP